MDAVIKVKKKLLKGDVPRAILEAVAGLGRLSVIMLTPDLLAGFRGNRININPKVINNARRRLLKTGLLEGDHGGYVKLTKKGEERLRKYRLSNYELIIPRVWDKKWRVLIFDIEESKKYLRDKIRNTLISIGFKRVQDSVWVYPYDCEDLVALLKIDFNVGWEVLYLVVEKIENDLSLRRYFSLD